MSVAGRATAGEQLKDFPPTFLVAAAADPAKPITLKITVDGVAQPDVTVTMSQLYTLFSSNNYAEHTVDITISDPGFEAYTFTFG